MLDSFPQEVIPLIQLGFFNSECHTQVYEDDLNKEDNLKNEDNLKIKTSSKKKKTSKKKKA